MMDRRELMLGAFGLSSVTALSTESANTDSSTRYEHAVHSTWAPMRVDPSKLELVRFATLAANSHNTQPWKFSIKEKTISIAPDYARRCPIVDPDDHHLFVSLGCTTENLMHAAAATGLKSNPVFENDVVTIVFEKAPPISSPLFEAIPRRQSTRAVYDGKPVSPDDLCLLEQAGIDDGVAVLIITDRTRMAKVTEYVVRGNTSQMQDKAFMNELKAWLRFSEADAVATMDGLFSRASGNPVCRHGWHTSFIPRAVRTTNIAPKSIARLALPYSPRNSTTRIIGLQRDVPVSGSPCRRRSWD